MPSLSRPAAAALCACLLALGAAGAGAEYPHDDINAERGAQRRELDPLVFAALRPAFAAAEPAPPLDEVLGDRPVYDEVRAKYEDVFAVAQALRRGHDGSAASEERIRARVDSVARFLDIPGGERERLAAMYLALEAELSPEEYAASVAALSARARALAGRAIEARAAFERTGALAPELEKEIALYHGDLEGFLALKQTTDADAERLLEESREALRALSLSSWISANVPDWSEASSGLKKSLFGDPSGEAPSAAGANVGSNLRLYRELAALHHAGGPAGERPPERLLSLLKKRSDEDTDGAVVDAARRALRLNKDERLRRTGIAFSPVPPAEPPPETVQSLWHRLFPARHPDAFARMHPVRAAANRFVSGDWGLESAAAAKSASWALHLSNLARYRAERGSLPPSEFVSRSLADARETVIGAPGSLERGTFLAIDAAKRREFARDLAVFSLGAIPGPAAASSVAADAAFDKEAGEKIPYYAVSGLFAAVTSPIKTGKTAAGLLWRPLKNLLGIKRPASEILAEEARLARLADARRRAALADSGIDPSTMRPQRAPGADVPPDPELPKRVAAAPGAAAPPAQGPPLERRAGTGHDGDLAADDVLDGRAEEVIRGRIVREFPSLETLSGEGPGRFVHLGTNDIDLAQMKRSVEGRQIPGVWDVSAHGTPDSIEAAGGVDWPAARVAEALVKRGHNGEPIRLVSCSTGGVCKKFKDNVAQQLADRLGVPVLAPTRVMEVADDGAARIMVAVQDEGALRVFLPRGTRLSQFQRGARPDAEELDRSLISSFERNQVQTPMDRQDLAERAVYADRLERLAASDVSAAYGPAGSVRGSLGRVEPAALRARIETVPDDAFDEFARAVHKRAGDEAPYLWFSKNFAALKRDASFPLSAFLAENPGASFNLLFDYAGRPRSAESIRRIARQLAD